MKAWIDENMVLFIAIVAASVLLVIAIGLLIAWISSRGKFMFLDGVVRNRGAVREPWREFRSEGNSLFLFRIVHLNIVFATLFHFPPLPPLLFLLAHPLRMFQLVTTVV